MLTIFRNNSQALQDAMEKLENLLMQSKEFIKKQEDNSNQQIKLLSDNLNKILNLYKRNRFSEIDGFDLVFSQDVGVSRTILNEVINFLNQGLQADTSPKELLEDFSIIFFADFYELELSYLNETLPREISEFNSNTLYDSRNFSHENFNEINRIATIIPSIVLRKYATSENMQLIQNIKNDSNAIQLSALQLKSLNDEVVNLQKTLEKQKTQFNFVGLSDGFKSLKSQKQKELNSERWIYWPLMALILVIIIVKLIWTYSYLNSSNPNLQLLAVVSISFILMLLVVIYFFRISLVNIKSIKSQILQIDLRLTLCQFIHNYNKDSASLRGEGMKESLEKFESVIFSPIVATDDKIPSTFEGIEQLSGLIGLVSKKAP